MDYKLKFEQSRLKLHQAYEKARNERSRIVVIDILPIQVTSLVNNTVKKKKQHIVEYCKAITMCGEQCKSKVKKDGLCGRHLKKTCNNL